MVQTLAVILALCVGAVAYILYDDYAYHSRLLADCMKDKKEYECYAMLKDNNQVIPVFIPTGR